MISKAQQKKNRQKWLKALRSGKYKQTRMTLKDEDGFCCLGVLCDVYAQAQKIEDAWARSSGCECYQGEDSQPPGSVTDWVGLRTRSGSYTTKKGGCRSLVHLNDDCKMSFKQIANIIEKEPDGLFVS